jgi:hypothetical protein
VEFEKQYQNFITMHKGERSGENLRRLVEGHDHAERMFLEKVWFPAVGCFDFLVPEYEVHDFKDGVRYLDFAYLRPPHKICIEIDGYGSHMRDVNRWQFSDHLLRQNDLVSDDWKVYRFSYDDLKEKPRRCQQSLQQLMGKWYGSGLPEQEDLSLVERELVKLTIKLHPKALTPTEAMAHIRCSGRFTRILLHRLVARNLLLPAAGNKRIRSYRIHPKAVLPGLW